MTPAGPVFYYDLGDPECYLVAERINSALAVVPEWEPVLGERFERDRRAHEEIEQLAIARGLQPVRWPRTWPPETHQAMLAAAYAKRIGRAVAFSLAAFRQAFAAARDLGDENTVLIAAAACEMHPTAVLKGVGLRSTVEALEAATQRATAAGVVALPAIQLDGLLFTGDDGVEAAAGALR